MNFAFYNDTGKVVYIHPATFIHGCSGDNSPIKHLETRVFILPENTSPWVKMWSHGEKALKILVSPVLDNKE